MAAVSSSPPEQGQLVRVRERQYVVADVAMALVMQRRNCAARAADVVMALVMQRRNSAARAATVIRMDMTSHCSIRNPIAKTSHRAASWLLRQERD